MIQFSSSTFECQVLPEERLACTQSRIRRKKERERKKNRKEKRKTEQKKKTWPKKNRLALFTMKMHSTVKPSPQKKGRKAAVPSFRLREMQEAILIGNEFPQNITHCGLLLNSPGSGENMSPWLAVLEGVSRLQGSNQSQNETPARLECSLVVSPNLPSWFHSPAIWLLAQDQSPGLRVCTLPHGWPGLFQKDPRWSSTYRNRSELLFRNKFWHLNLTDLGGCLQFTRLTVPVFKYFNSCWSTNFGLLNFLKIRWKNGLVLKNKNFIILMQEWLTLASEIGQ